MQVILNLQANAVKFTQKGQVKILADMIKENDDTMLQVKVIDTGVGISK